MAFCTKCGKELREDDLFCSHCGHPVRDEQGSENGGAQRQSQTYENTRQQGPVQNGMSGFGKKRVWMIAGAAVAALVLIVVLGISAWKILGGLVNKTKYVTYSNDTVCFTVDYPEGYTVTEPDSNNVLITDGEEADFQVAIEYAYSTISNSAIYSAADFAEQVEMDSRVLTDWLGTEDVQITDSLKTEVSGKDCYEYDFELQIEGVPHTGKLYIFDSKGEFGCYSFFWVINENSKYAERYKEQISVMEDSFEITGACQAEGYSIYEFNDPEIRFMVSDSAVGEIEQYDESVAVYPVEGIYSEANVWIDESSSEVAELDAIAALERECSYYFKYKDQTQYISQAAEMTYGRYPCTGIDLEYYYHGDHYTMSTFVIEHDGVYWNVCMETTDEYYDAAATAVTDVLFSLKIGDETPSGTGTASSSVESEQKDSSEDASLDTEDMLESIIDDIKDKSTTSIMSEPLGVVDDFNGDGVQEFLAVYEAKDSSGISVMYELWSLQGDGPEQIGADELFAEVGGNAGAIGIVESDGTVYLAIEREEPAGESFNNYYIYYPWDSDQSSLGEEAVYLESHGSYGQEEKGEYILGDTKVDKSKFTSRYEELSDWIYKIDPLSGADGDVKPLDEIK